jgi:hypothetical protein
MATTAGCPVHRGQAGAAASGAHPARPAAVLLQPVPAPRGPATWPGLARPGAVLPPREDAYAIWLLGTSQDRQHGPRPSGTPDCTLAAFQCKHWHGTHCCSRDLQRSRSRSAQGPGRSAWPRQRASNGRRPPWTVSRGRAWARGPGLGRCHCVPPTPGLRVPAGPKSMVGRVIGEGPGRWGRAGALSILGRNYKPSTTCPGSGGPPRVAPRVAAAGLRSCTGPGGGRGLRPAGAGCAIHAPDPACPARPAGKNGETIKALQTYSGEGPGRGGGRARPDQRRAWLPGARGTRKLRAAGRAGACGRGCSAAPPLLACPRRRPHTN